MKSSYRHSGNTSAASHSTATTACEKYTPHILSKKWTLWANVPNTATEWVKENYLKVCNFTTMENTIAIMKILPDVMVKSSMLFVMREHVTPYWEDPKNCHGGRFSYKVSNKYVCSVWEKLVYALVGESLSLSSSFSNDVMGISISPKRNFCIIKIWMCNCTHQNPNDILNELVGLNSNGCLFASHKDKLNT